MIIETFLGALSALILAKITIDGVSEFGPAVAVALTACAVTTGGVGIVLLGRVLYAALSL